MMDVGPYSYSEKAPHDFESVLLVVLAGIAAALVVYPIVSRKFFSLGIPFILSAIVVFQEYFIKKLNVRFFVDLMIFTIGLCISWFDRNIRKKD